MGCSRSNPDCARQPTGRESVRIDTIMNSDSARSSPNDGRDCPNGSGWPVCVGESTFLRDRGPFGNRIVPPPHARHHTPRGPFRESAAIQTADHRGAGVHRGETLRSAGWIVCVGTQQSIAGPRPGRQTKLRGRLHVGHHGAEADRTPATATHGPRARCALRIDRSRSPQG